MTNQTPSNSVVTEAMIEKLWRTARHQSWADFAKEVRLAMQSANTTGSACSLGEMHGMASCFTNAEGVRCCDFCGNPVTTESDELVGDEPVRCGHEAYQGYCAHCGVPIINGVAKVSRPSRAIATPDTDRVAVLEEELRHFIDIIDGTEQTGFDPHVEQMLMDAAETSRAALSQQGGDNA